MNKQGVENLALAKFDAQCGLGVSEAAASPDVLVVPHGSTAPGAASTKKLDVVTIGAEHDVYVRVRNGGNAAAQGVVVRVYCTEHEGVLDRKSWTYVGDTAPFDVANDDAPVVAGPIVWTTDKVPGEPGERLLVAFLGTVHTKDDLPGIAVDLLEPSNFAHLVRKTGLAAAARVTVLAAPATPVVDDVDVPGVEVRDGGCDPRAPGTLPRTGGRSSGGSRRGRTTGPTVASARRRRSPRSSRPPGGS